MSERFTSAHVLALFAIVLAVGGNAVAFTLGKNSVGTRELKNKAVGTSQLKGNAVTKNKIKKNSVNGVKVKNNSLTGADIKLTKLGTVPSAKSAGTAGSANSAGSAIVAQTASSSSVANIANALTPAEDWHEVGAPGEPGFLNSWENEGGKRVTAAFFKDQVGIVHLKGQVRGGTDDPIFRLPVGYRPTRGKFEAMAVPCTGSGLSCESGAGAVAVVGSNFGNGSVEGDVVAPPEATFLSLDGISFRAES